MSNLQTLKALRDELSDEADRLSARIDALDAACEALQKVAASPADDPRQEHPAQQAAEDDGPKRRRRTKAEMELAREVEAAGGPAASDTSDEAEAARAEYAAGDATPSRSHETGVPGAVASAHHRELDLPGEVVVGAQKPQEASAPAPAPAPEAPPAASEPAAAPAGPAEPSPPEAEALMNRAREAAMALRDRYAKGDLAKNTIAKYSEHPSGKLSGVPAKSLRELVRLLEDATNGDEDDF